MESAVLEIPLSQYIAYNAPDKALSIIEGFGIRPDTGSKQEMSMILSQIVHRVGEKALYTMAINHPDKEMILAAAAAEKNEKKSGACGCSSFEGKSNCSGCGGGCGGKEPSSNMSTTDDMQKLVNDGAPMNAAEAGSAVMPKTQASNNAGAYIFGGIVLVVAGILIAKM